MLAGVAIGAIAGTRSSAPRAALQLVALTSVQQLAVTVLTAGGGVAAQVPVGGRAVGLAVGDHSLWAKPLAVDVVSPRVGGAQPWYGGEDLDQLWLRR